MGGVGKYSETDVDLSEKESVIAEKKGVLKQLAGLFGYDLVKKGEVKDRYTANSKSSNFWTAFYALEDTLQKYNQYTENYDFETDDDVIKEALSEFSEIITGVLAMPNIVKSLTESKPKNIQNESEEPEMTKEEILKQIDESVKKAVETLVPAAPAEASKTEEPVNITAEKVQIMVDEAVTKAVEPILKSRVPANNLDGEKSVEKNETEHYLAGIL
jgi:hypothetical protein